MRDRRIGSRDRAGPVASRPCSRLARHGREHTLLSLRKSVLCGGLLSFGVRCTGRSRSPLRPGPSLSPSRAAGIGKSLGSIGSVEQHDNERPDSPSGRSSLQPSTIALVCSHPIPKEVLMGTITGGAIAGYVTLVIILVGCVVTVVGGWISRDDYAVPSGSLMAGGIVTALITVGVWWVCMAFTTSGDYHAWNVKEGKVDRVAKRLIATDKGMAERYVVTINGQPYGIDDTRAALVQQGDSVSFRCKKDFQWGVPREAHGWACRWNKVPGFEGS